MSNTRQALYFDPNGPKDVGLVEWLPIDPDELVSGEPVQRVHIYHEMPDIGYLAGVWDCTAMTEHMGPYPVDEFMLLLEGSLTLGLPDGSDVTVDAGQALVIPKGFECQWKQSGYLKKFFMISDDPVAVSAQNPSLRRITIPDLTKRFSNGGADTPIVTVRTDFVNSTCSTKVQLHDYVAVDYPECTITENLLIHVLDGVLSISLDGKVQSLEVGDTCYLVRGAVARWSTAANTRLLISSYAQS